MSFVFLGIAANVLRPLYYGNRSIVSATSAGSRGRVLFATSLTDFGASSAESILRHWTFGFVPYCESPNCRAQTGCTEELLTGSVVVDL